ncbi:MAG: Ger(x)C family spore germination protein [Ruminococcaceae bacterium]|nr:Ger(x)C family spore germination protein [Oscillospiraceae bacterium]
MKKIFVTFLLLLLCLSLTGCWDRREIGNVTIVMGFAVDTGDKEDEIEITAQVANTSTISAASEKGSGGGGGGNEKPYLNLTSSAKSVLPAVRSSVTKSGSKLYMSHNYVILFGQEVAEKGLGKYIDFFLRDHELRLDMNLLVARGRGADILDADTGFQSIPALHIHELVNAQEKISTGMTVSVLDFVNRLAAGRSAPLIPIIETREEGETQVLNMRGTAVFSDDAMIGELNERETRGLLWITNKVEQAVLVIPIGEDNVTVEVQRSSGSMSAETDENGQVTMVLRVDARGAIGSEQGQGNYTTKDGTNALLAAFAGEIEGEIRACLEKSRRLQADVFAFSDVIYRRHPGLWDKMQGEPFYNLPVRIEVKTNLSSSGRIGSPVGAE